ncbi:hypothetical protein E2493_20220 [Sphingomonas parva]|uniref:Uncharacterized protein n=1 Tax=Sphingomonas parva TaxID=2555898 RepID=A0A4Y8ZME9_9SPHN|nr:hypothetical protein [Sphingomonas parva]TFI56432.1 hypothetical protein E2493_20220 [Sphingomonas parva]
MTRAIAARLVMTPGQAQPYKLVIEHDDMTVTEQAVASCREGEALLRAALAHKAEPRPRHDPWNPPLIGRDAAKAEAQPRPLQGA